MAWIELHQGLPSHRKTMALRRRLDISRAQAVGHMCMLWLWCLENAQQGCLNGMTEQDISEASGWEGEAIEFTDALREVGFLDDKSVHDWHDYAGRLIEQRERKREFNRVKQRNAREKRAKIPSETADSSTASSDSVQTVHVVDNTSTTILPTVPNQPNQPNPTNPTNPTNHTIPNQPYQPYQPYPRAAGSQHYINQRVYQRGALDHLISNPFDEEKET